jgi:O-antigen ligase
MMDAHARTDRTNSYLEKILVICLSGLAITLFIGWKDNGLFKAFNLMSLGTLLVWRYAVKNRSHYSIPRPVFVTSFLFLAVMTVSAFMSAERQYAFFLLKLYRFIFLGGLLFVAPIRDQYRKYIIVVFFLAAVAAGLTGIGQYFGFVQGDELRATGFSVNPNFYAGIMAIACGSAISVLLIYNSQFPSKRWFFPLTIVVVVTASGVLLSQTRSMWVAIIVAAVSTLYLYERRKAIILLCIIIFFFAVIILSNNTFRQRTTSVVTSFITQNTYSSTGNRIELWKGALIMFKESPLLGIGLGDFQKNAEQLISEKKLKQLSDTNHAHSIYLQVLATRGTVGFIVLIALLISLLRWGNSLIRKHNAIGGYIIVFISLLTMIGGLTDDYIEIIRFLAAYCFALGLFGPIDIDENQRILLRD